MTNKQKYKTPEERVKAFVESKGGHLSGNIGDLYAFARWLAIEEEEDKPEPCPFCGEDMTGRCRSYGPSIWSLQCSCGYKSEDFITKTEAIATHNRVCKAVKASKKGDAK